MNDNLYSDIDKCKKDLLLAREKFGLVTTTKRQYDAIEKALAMMYLYCPESIRETVYATLLESSHRRMHYELNIWKD